MGQLIDGRWHTDKAAIELEKGRFVRRPSQFRHLVEQGADARFPAAAGRYHLYVSLQCPWAWRTIVYRSIKRLQSAISMSVAIPDGRHEGWRFGNWVEGATADHVEGFTHLYQAYVTSQADYTGVVSVPVLWDKQTRQIVNNESSNIIRMLNGAFDAFTDAKEDYYPSELRADIDAKNHRIYTGLNNAVYRAGAAETQEAYEKGYTAIFDTLDWAEDLLDRSRFFNGDRITETDWHFAASLFRFDPVYYSLFRCNRQRLADFPNLSNYLRDIYQRPGVAETVNVRHIVLGYYSQSWNPSGIIPLGPRDYQEWLARPHDRERFSAA
ncbi:MAG TPA: glutathione S-transferase C-terminal domain-containing protein [Steroidobacter sp.]|uniref:glutathione S-transferase family protein n=1 Tax=Steroidobacter sp. TaxID=1978227 RepID=UPI002EDB1E18